VFPSARMPVARSAAASVASLPSSTRTPGSPSRAAATTVLPAGGRTASLRIVEGPGAGRRHRVKPSTLIGRLPECDVTLDDPSVSRRHARLVSEQGRWRIEDLGSTNGVRVNGEAVDERTLHDGDHLELGSVHLVFSLDG